MAINKMKGTYDVLPTDAKTWQYVENVLRSVCEIFNYKEIRTPIFESTELFHRSAGDSSDIVTKETYDFVDRGNRNVSLRPEGTAGVVRSVIENKLYADPNQPQKLYYIGPMFRYERPQKGRYRQHTQFGVEVLGASNPAIDAEVISLVVTVYKLLGLKGVKVKLNTLGDETSRDTYREALIKHFKLRIDEFCGDCKTRLEKNPLRVLDCKVDREHELMQTAPKMVDYLSDEAKEYFDNVKSYLEALEIDYDIDSNLVRGLDYYNHTVFEIQADIEGFGAQNTLCGGGRYNKLISELGGPETPGIGFGFGMERLLLALELEGIKLVEEDKIDVFLITLGEKAKHVGVKLTNILRLEGFVTDTDYLDRSLKAQFKQADRYNARFTLILGEEELEKGQINIKDNQSNEQYTVGINVLLDYLDSLMMQGHGHSCGCGSHGHDHGHSDHECCSGGEHECGDDCECHTEENNDSCGDNCGCHSH